MSKIEEHLDEIKTTAGKMAFSLDEMETLTRN